jgi:hypothetical protein
MFSTLFSTLIWQYPASSDDDNSGDSDSDLAPSQHELDTISSHIATFHNIHNYHITALCARHTPLDAQISLLNAYPTTALYTSSHFITFIATVISHIMNDRTDGMDGMDAYIPPDSWSLQELRHITRNYILTTHQSEWIAAYIYIAEACERIAATKRDILQQINDADYSEMMAQLAAKRVDNTIRFLADKDAYINMAVCKEMDDIAVRHAALDERERVVKGHEYDAAHYIEKCRAQCDELLECEIAKLQLVTAMVDVKRCIIDEYENIEKELVAYQSSSILQISALHRKRFHNSQQWRTFQSKLTAWAAIDDSLKLQYIATPKSSIQHSK